jgi:hypothetical protein
MKKTAIVFCIVAALLTLINASVWEGAASSSPGGDLPDTGYYVATNSFPRNTVVDITNLENGRTIRVIVSASLDSPGLLAVLSKDAAGAIGLPARSIGRIRMNQPADPVAFSRFTEGLSRSGDPDRDPAAFVAANGIDPELLASEKPAAEPGLPPAAVVAVPAAPAPAAPVEEPPAASEALESPAADPPVGVPEDSAIVDVPDSYEGPPSAAPDDGIIVESRPVPAAGIVPEEETIAESQPVPAGTAPEDESTATPVSDSPPELVWAPYTERENVELYEPEPEEDKAEVTELIEGGAGEASGLAEAPEPAVLETPPAVPGTSPADYDYTLVPSEERPPEAPEPFIPPAAAYPLWPGEAPADPVTPASPPDLTPPSADIYEFSVPVISSLERGKYYLQLAAYSKADTVESELTKIGHTYPLTVQNAGSPDKPVYRILVGPVNLGESGALLQRFRGTYSDAFVRQGN